MAIWRRARRNNHVERTNRTFRFLEKVRYKWRGRRTLVSFAVLTLDGIWKEWAEAERKGAEDPNQVRNVTSQTRSNQRSIRAA